MNFIRKIATILCLGMFLFSVGCTTEQLDSVLNPDKQLNIEIIASPSVKSAQAETLKDKVDVAVKVTGGSGAEIIKVEGYVQDENSPLALSGVGNDTWIGQWDTNCGKFPNGNYQLIVAVTDGLGKVYSNGKTFKVENEQGAPVVRITSPAANAELTGTVVIVSEATSASSSIEKIEFYIDGALVVSDTTAPYSYSWNTLSGSDKNYTIKTKVFDAQGKTGEDTIVVKVNNNLAPTVDLLAPVAGETLSGIKTLKADAQAKGNKTISKVEFYRGAVLLGTVSSAPYSYNWDTTSLTNGNYILFARAYDSANKSGDSATKQITVNNQVTPDDEKPVVQVLSPGEGAEGLNGEIKVTGTVTDDKGLEKVELYVDNNLAKTYNVGGAKTFDLNYSMNGTVNNQSFSPMAAYTSPAAVDWQKVTDFGSNPGSLTMYMHVPANMPENAPVVVVLHGCSQSAASYRDDTKWNVLADKYKFYTVYAEQTANMACMYWFDSRRDGLAQSIANMATYMKSKYSVDSNRIFVTGLSAGGAMTTNVLALQPSIFKAGAPMAGIAYGASSSSMQTPQAGSTVTKCSGANCPRVFVFQGTSDSMVAPGNADMIRKQWTKANGVDDTADNGGSTLKTYPYEEYKDASGNVRVAVVKITGMSHGISVDPNGTGEDAGGSTSMWSLNKGLYSSYYAAKFFGILGGVTPPPADQAPVVSITAPVNGAANLQGTVSVTASASDDKALSKAEFYVNGALKDTKNISGTQANASFSWNTSGLSNGSYSLTVKVYDSNAQTGEHSISVAVGEGMLQIGAGAHTITIKAYDNNSQVTVKTVNFSVGVVSPEVAILSPAGGTFQKPNPIAVTGTSKSASKIEVKLVGASSGSVYSTVTLLKADFPAGLDSWNASLATGSIYMSGGYKITAQAFDAAGNSTSVQSVSITVNK